MYLPLILLPVEALVIFADWLVTRLRHETPQRRKVRCPVDGAPARLVLSDVHGVPSPVNLIRCSLLEGRGARSCDRACLRSPEGQSP